MRLIQFFMQGELGTLASDMVWLHFGENHGVQPEDREVIIACMGDGGLLKCYDVYNSSYFDVWRGPTRFKSVAIFDDRELVLRELHKAGATFFKKSSLEDLLNKKET